MLLASDQTLQELLRDCEAQAGRLGREVAALAEEWSPRDHPKQG